MSVGASPAPAMAARSTACCAGPFGTVSALLRPSWLTALPTSSSRARAAVPQMLPALMPACECKTASADGTAALPASSSVSQGDTRPSAIAEHASERT
eukprot:352687-Chlamydomonas_euryale.AAC.2